MIEARRCAPSRFPLNYFDLNKAQKMMFFLPFPRTMTLTAFRNVLNMFFIIFKGNRRSVAFML